MKRVKSKHGVLALVLYLAIAAITWAYANSCSQTYCGLATLGPIMPWPFLTGFVSKTSSLYFVLILINGLIYYLAGHSVKILANQPRFKTVLVKIQNKLK